MKLHSIKNSNLKTFLPKLLLSCFKLSDVVWPEDDNKLSLNLSEVDGGCILRSTESLGDFESGVDADDVRSLDEPL